MVLATRSHNRIETEIQPERMCAYMAFKITQVTALLLMMFCLTGISPKDLDHEFDFYQCSKNPDERYDRHLLLEKLDSTLKNSIPAYAEFPARGFFVYDLSDPKNKYIPGIYVQGDACI